MNTTFSGFERYIGGTHNDTRVGGIGPDFLDGNRGRRRVAGRGGRRSARGQDRIDKLNEPEAPSEETDEVLDWEGMGDEPICASANPCDA